MDISDPMLEEAIRCVFEAGQASASMLQRRLRLSYARAGRLLDEMEQMGIVDHMEGGNPRKVLTTYQQWIKSQRVSRKNNIVLDKELLRKTVPATSKNMKKIIGIDIDYNDGGYFIQSLKNMLIPKSSDDIQTKFINNIIRYSSSSNMRLLLLPNNLSYDRYNELSHLLIPITFDTNKHIVALNWALSESYVRLKTFSRFNVNNIKDYNEIYITNPKEIIQMPYIVIVIQELYMFSNLSGVEKNIFEDSITKLLLNSEASGIYLFIFSKLSKKKLSLGAKEDLLKIGNKDDLEEIFIK